MRFDKVKTSFMIENTDLENYSFNLIHYFMDKENYSIFNFEEKILENFNHEYYNIIFVYSQPLYGDDNIETLLEKIAIIKRKLKRHFFMFHPSILVLATNCTVNCEAIEAEGNVDIIDVSSREQLYSSELLNDVFKELKTYPLNLSFEQLSYNINYLSMVYAKKVSAIFNKKHYIVNTVLAGLIILLLMLIGIFPTIRNFLVLSKEQILNFRYYTLITNSLNEIEVLNVVISLFLIFSFGLRVEKIYGSYRYLTILLATTLITNSIIFAFYHDQVSTLGFSPIIYGLFGSFIYVLIFFRRFLAFTLKRILYYNVIFIFLFLIFGDDIQLLAIVCSIFLGFILGFITGIPKTKNGNIKNRMLTLFLLFVLVFLTISIGLK